MKQKIEVNKKYIKLDEKYRKKLFPEIDFFIFQERAALMEFEGGMNAEEAAEFAFIDTIKRYAYEQTI
jgi:hypothetical protein